MIDVLYSAYRGSWDDYRDPLREAFAEAGLDVNLATDHAPEDVRYIVYSPGADVTDFTPYINLKAVLNLWAGVESIVGNPTLKVPLTRMVDPGMKQGMTDYVVAHVMRHLLDLDVHIKNQDGVWRQAPPPMASERRVGILGLGELGRAVGQALAGLGFAVSGWSRTPQTVDSIDTVHGPEGFASVVESADFLVLLLPHTSQTEKIMKADVFRRMKKGSVLINPGRGPLIDDDALLAALDAGPLAHATLDVFREEPLPKTHAFWSHPKVTVTPHIAAYTRPSTSARVIAENIRRGEAGEPFLHQVDLTAGY